ALAGAAVLAWGAIHVTSALGLVFLFLSAASWSAYTVIGRSIGHRVTALQATVLPVTLSVVVFAFGPLFEDWRPGGTGPLVLAVALGFFGSGLAYVTWNFGIARVPAARGGGASGRNGGFVLSWWAKFGSLKKVCSGEDAVRLAHASAEAVDGIGAFCSEHRIDAHYRRDGWLWAATSEAQLGAWEETLETV